VVLSRIQNGGKVASKNAVWQGLGKMGAPVLVVLESFDEGVDAFEGLLGKAVIGGGQGLGKAPDMDVVFGKGTEALFQGGGLAAVAEMGVNAQESLQVSEGTVNGGIENPKVVCPGFAKVGVKGFVHGSN
jgi:hypothetical protein